MGKMNVKRAVRYNSKAEGDAIIEENGKVLTDRYKNIDDGLIPFRYSTGVKANSNMNIRDAVILCQKCYYNFAIFRNTIDLMTEFSCSNIYFKGGSQKSKDFFLALFKKINLFDFQDKFFREYYRSGNVFIYRF